MYLNYNSVNSYNYQRNSLLFASNLPSIKNPLWNQVPLPKRGWHPSLPRNRFLTVTDYYARRHQTYSNLLTSSEILFSTVKTVQATAINSCLYFLIKARTVIIHKGRVSSSTQNYGWVYWKQSHHQATRNDNNSNNISYNRIPRCDEIC